MISANLGHEAQVLSGPDDRAFCSHFGVSDAFDASALVADGAALLRPSGSSSILSIITSQNSTAVEEAATDEGVAAASSLADAAAGLAPRGPEESCAYTRGPR